MKYIQPDQAIPHEIIIEDFKYNVHFQYRKRKKFLGITIEKEGLYEFPYSTFREKIDEMPYHSMLKEDGNVYWKPNIQISYPNNDFTQKFFETYEEAKEYAKTLADKYGLILR
jgi:hypothetical protein